MNFDNASANHQMLTAIQALNNKFDSISGQLNQLLGASVVDGEQLHDVNQRTLTGELHVN